MVKKTVTTRVLEANRANANRSTGPKTQSGKARSKSNAVKHGLLSRYLIFADDAERDEHAALLSQFLLDARPTTIQEALLVEEIVGCFWKLGFAFAWEAGALKSRHATSLLALKAFAAQTSSPAGTQGTPDVTPFGVEADDINVDSFSLTARSGGGDETGDRGETVVAVRLTTSLETVLRYQSRIKHDLYRAIDQLERLQGRRGSTAGT